MLALVALVERGVFESGDRLAGYEGLGVRFALDAAKREAPRCEVLGLGDSVVKFGFDPKTVEDRLGVNAYNLAVPGTPPPLAYALFQRALAAGARPKVVVIGQMSLAGNSWSHVDQFGEFAGVVECVALALSCRDLKLLGALLGARAIPSLRYRNALRAAVQGGLVEVSAKERRSEWTAGRGAELRPVEGSSQGHLDPAIEDRLTSQRWGVDAVFEQYLRRLTDLAHARGIAVVWLIPPMRPEIQARRDALGLDVAHTKNLQAIHKRMSGVVLLDARHSGYTKDDFFDAVHLNSRGASKLSHAISAVIADQMPTLQAKGHTSAPLPGTPARVVR